MSTQADLDNHANQCNPNNDEYYNSRGIDRDDDTDESSFESDNGPSQADLDNHANQCNSNNEEYYNSRQ